MLVVVPGHYLRLIDFEMYGEVKMSAKKPRAANMATGNQESMASIADRLNVTIATADVYTIDAFVNGADIDLEFLCDKLRVEKDLFYEIKYELLNTTGGLLNVIPEHPTTKFEW